MDKWMDGWVGGRVTGWWIGECMDGQMDRYLYFLHIRKSVTYTHKKYTVKIKSTKLCI